VITMNSELIDRTGISPGAAAGCELSPRDERQVMKEVSRAQSSALVRAYRVEIESRLSQRKVAALSSVARAAMGEVALVHALEDGLLKSVANTPLAGVAVERLDLVSREFSASAAVIMRQSAQRISDL
jgi:DICT domain-containing protein